MSEGREGGGTPRAQAEREELEALLPWYMSGALDEADRRRAEELLARHPDAERLEAARAERDAIAALHEEITPPDEERALQRLFARIDAEEAAAPQPAEPSPQARRGDARSGLSGLAERLSEWLAVPGLSGPRLAAAAAAVVIVAQAGVIALLLATGGDGTAPGFRTASGPPAAEDAAGPRLLVAFREDASVADVREALAAAEARVVGGPSGAGVFTVALPEESGPEAAARALERLRADPAVRFVGPADPGP